MSKEIRNSIFSLSEGAASSGQSWSSYWIDRDVFQYLWIGDYTGDNLKSEVGSDVITVTNKDWTTKFIPATTSATFAVPNNATYLANDGTDDFWFDAANTLLQKTGSNLIERTTARTFILYSNTAPYFVSLIGILKSDVVLTDADTVLLTKFFKLWVQYWGEEMMEQGYMKDNRDFIET